MSYSGLASIFRSVHEHLSLASKPDKPVLLDSIRTYLKFRKEEYLGKLPTHDDLGSVFENELHRMIFAFMFEFLERNDPESWDSAASAHSQEEIPEGSLVEDKDKTCDLHDPLDSFSDDGKGLKLHPGEEEMEAESEDHEIQDDKDDLLSGHDPVYSLSNDGVGLKDPEGEEEMGDEPGDGAVQDNKGDLLSRHLVTDVFSLDSTHQPI